MDLPKHLANIRHVIWDWNGTLLDDAFLCIEVMNGLLGPRKLPMLDAARYQDLFCFPVRDYYLRLGFDFAADPFEKVGTDFIVGYQERQGECRLQRGAEEALAALAARGIGCSILSASQQWRLDEQSTRLGVRSRFSAVLGLTDHFAGGKLENGRRWMAQLGIDPGQVLLVGDTDHDCEVARDIGVRCVLVPSGHQSATRLEALGVPVLNSLADLASPAQAA
ncbi:MAG TPA: HAD hydrolase-like protein [Myxococcales bacterium]|jgi:phosphoglycolate phosphatase